jgi:hypothetical protein
LLSKPFAFAPYASAIVTVRGICNSGFYYARGCRKKIYFFSWQDSGLAVIWKLQLEHFKKAEPGIGIGIGDIYLK